MLNCTRLLKLNSEFPSPQTSTSFMGVIGISKTRGLAVYGRSLKFTFLTGGIKFYSLSFRSLFYGNDTMERIFSEYAILKDEIESYDSACTQNVRADYQSCGTKRVGHFELYRALQARSARRCYGRCGPEGLFSGPRSQTPRLSPHQLLL